MSWVFLPQDTPHLCTFKYYAPLYPPRRKEGAFDLVLISKLAPLVGNLTLHGKQETMETNKAILLKQLKPILKTCITVCVDGESY